MEERGEYWSRVAQTSAFQDLMQKKKIFIIPATIFFFIFYMGLPILAGFTTVLNAQVIGALSLAWIYALAQFIMTWTLLHLYVSQANKWDKIVDQVRNETAANMDNMNGANREDRENSADSADNANGTNANETREEG